MNPPGTVLAVLWAQYGPYHFARVAAFSRLTDSVKVQAIEFASQSRDYRWLRSAPVVPLITLHPGGVTEELSFTAVFLRLRKKLAELNVNVCLLPSYSPKQSLAALLAAKSLGIRTVMMNETHAGTAHATGFSSWIKRRLIGLFDAALVGGAPQKRYFASLGLPEERIFTGYDAVDNDYYARRAEEIRSRGSEMRARYNLPEHYFLSLGRFVAKKNLVTLLRAYRQVLDARPGCQTHLVLVGSGEEEPALRSLCSELALPVCNHSEPKFTPTALCRGIPHGSTELTRVSALRTPAVHFHGFRQIEENPAFYSLADAFILPSRKEEWGLVVNEAMASSLPVIVSETAGCAEDLLEAVRPDETFPSVLSSLPAQMGLGNRVRANGLVFDPDSSEELSRAMLLLESSPELRSAMGRAGRRIVNRFSCDNFAKNALLAAEMALAGCPPKRLPMAVREEKL